MTGHTGLSVRAVRPRFTAGAMLAGVWLALAAGIHAPPAAGQQPPLPPFDQSRLYVTEAQFQRAIQPYQAAIAANPRNAMAHHWLGFAYVFAYRQFGAGSAPFAGGYLTRGITILREAIRLDPGLIAAYVALHDALMMAGEFDQADRLLREQLFPRFRLPNLPS